MNTSRSPNHAAGTASHCPHCRSPLHLVPQLAGRQIRCVICRSVLTVTNPSVHSEGPEGGLVCRLVSVELPCPGCTNALRLIPELDGCQIRCRTCQTVLSVSVHPWNLSLVLPPSVAEDEEQDEDLVKPETPAEAAQGEADAPGVSEKTELPDADHARPQPKAQPSPREPRLLVEDSSTNRHAQSEPTNTAAAIGFLVIGAAVLGIAGLGAGTWWLFFSGSPLHPQARYLPAECREFVSLDWADVNRSGFDEPSQELPGLDLALTQRCRVFLANAGLQPGDLERINAGLTTNTPEIVVYWLKRPVRPDELFAKPAMALFKAAKKDAGPAEVIRGVPVYVYHDSALAFPEERAILSGKVPLVREILARRSKPCAAPLNQLLETLDFSATSIVATTGMPDALRLAHLKQHHELAASVWGTTDCYQYGPTIRFVRTLHVKDDASMWSLQQCLQTSLTQTARAQQSSSTVRSLLQGVRVSASGGTVRIELPLPASRLSKEALEALESLF